MKNAWSQFQAGKALDTTMERLSSGLRINKGADDPSGLGISAGMKAHIGGIGQALINAQEAISYLRLRDSGMTDQEALCNRVYELAVRAANEATLTSADMDKLNDEAQAMVSQLDAIGKGLKMRSTDGDNGVKALFDPGQLDVVWVLDSTGSMGGVIGAVATAAPQMVAQLTAKGFDLRMACVGYGAGNNVVTPTVLPGATDCIRGPGSRSLTDGATFAAEVTTLSTSLGGAQERGIDATLEAIWGTGIKAQMDARPDAKRVVILITDADSDDFLDVGANQNLTAGAAASAVRDFAVSSLDSIGAAYYVVSTITEGGGPFAADADYTDVSSRVAAGGGSMALDVPGAWVTTISTTLEAYGGPYSMMFQIGADNVAQDQLTLDFKTITAKAANISVSLTDANAASNSITNIKSALEFIATEHARTGEYMQRVQHLIEDLESERLNTIASRSRINDADMALEASEMGKQQIIMNSAVAISSQANSSPGVVLDLLSENNVGQSGAMASARSGL